MDMILLFHIIDIIAYYLESWKSSPNGPTIQMSELL